jgi:hypothetical protein
MYLGNGDGMKEIIKTSDRISGSRFELGHLEYEAGMLTLRQGVDLMPMFKRNWACRYAMLPQAYVN